MPAKKRGTKRSASAGASAHDCDRPAKKASFLSSSALRAIVAGLEGAGELPKETLSELADVIGWQLGAQRMDASTLDASIRRLHRALRDIEEKLVREVSALEAKEAAVGGDSRDLEVAMAIAEATLTATRQACVDNKASLKAIAREVEAARSEIQSAERARKNTELQLEALAKRTDCLHAAECTVKPLKSAAAKGSDGQKRLKTLKKVGADFGIHGVLLDTMPAVLKKPPDRRESFDNLAINQLEAQFTKQHNALEIKRNAILSELEDCSIRVKAAYDAMLSVQQQKDAATRFLDEATRYAEASKTELAFAQKRLKSYQVTSQQGSRQLGSLKERLAGFRKGVLVAFQELQPDGSEVDVHPLSPARPATDGSVGETLAQAQREIPAQMSETPSNSNNQKELESAPVEAVFVASASSPEAAVQPEPAASSSQPVEEDANGGEPSTPHGELAAAGVVGWFKRLIRSNSGRESFTTVEAAAPPASAAAGVSERQASACVEAAEHASDSECPADQRALKKVTLEETPKKVRQVKLGTKLKELGKARLKLLNKQMIAAEAIVREASPIQMPLNGNELPVPKGVPASFSPS